MTEATPTPLTDHSVPMASRRHLRIADGYADLFPDSVDTLSPQVIHGHDKRALLIMGALGFEQSFDTLDGWLRFSHARRQELEAELARNTRSTLAAIHTAARYTVSRANVIVRNYDHTGLPDPNQAAYWRVPKFRELSAEAQRNPLEKRSQQRVHLARISIFGEALYRANNPE